MQYYRAVTAIHIVFDFRFPVFHKWMHSASAGFKKEQRWRESSLFGSAADRPPLFHSSDGCAHHGMGWHPSSHGRQIVYGAYRKPKVIQWSSHRPKMHSQWKVIISVLYCFTTQTSIYTVKLLISYQLYIWENKILNIVQLKRMTVSFKRDEFLVC